MKSIKIHKFLLPVVCIIAIVLIILSAKVPMQEIKLTTVTAAEEYDMSGVTDLYCFKNMKAGSANTATIKFMAVKNRSEKLFTFHGKGQYVYLGCGELTGKYDFISVGRFLHIKLTLNAAQKDLKLEDGTPFDISRYSLKPVLTIEEQ